MLIVLIAEIKEEKRYIIRTNHKPAQTFDIVSASEAAGKVIEIIKGIENIIYAPDVIKEIIVKHLLENGAVRAIA